MDEIKRRDQAVFLKELFSPAPVLSVVAIALVALAVGSVVESKLLLWAIACVCAGGIVWGCYRNALEKRFVHPRFKSLWRECNDRTGKLNEALAQMRKHKIADLQELPQTVANLAPEIYRALRRADLVLHEVHKSESGLNRTVGQPLTSQVFDAQAQELYKIADRNVAEYSQHFKLALAGVERAEAQAIVFSTTLDTLRIRMLNYRLASKSPEAETMEFLNVVQEAKLQLRAIDSALEELDVAQPPTWVATQPGEQHAEAGREDK